MLCLSNVLPVKGAIGLGGGLFPAVNNFDPHLSNVNCSGIESRLIDCSNDDFDRCPTQENAVAFCQGELIIVIIIHYSFNMPQDG